MFYPGGESSPLAGAEAGYAVRYYLGKPFSSSFFDFFLLFLFVVARGASVAASENVVLLRNEVHVCEERVSNGV